MHSTQMQRKHQRNKSNSNSLSYTLYLEDNYSSKDKHLKQRTPWVYLLLVVMFLIILYLVYTREVPKGGPPNNFKV